MSVELWFIGVAFCLAAATSAAQAMARRDPLRAGLAVVMLVNLGMSMSLSAWQGWLARQLDLAAWCLALAMWPWCLKAGDDGEPSQARHWPLRGLAAWLVAGMLPGLLAAGTVSGVLAEQVSLWGRLAVAAWLVGAVWGQVSRRLDAAWAGLISAGALWGAWVAAGAAALGLETQTTMQAGQTGAWALCGVGLGLRRLQHLRAQLEAGRRTDPQTGLMSRDAWWELAEQQCDGAERHGYWLTVVVLGFRAEPDDVRRHEQWIAALGRTIRPSIRKADLVARWDDGWLVMALPHTTVDAVPQLMGRWQDAVTGVVPEGREALVAGLAALEDGQSLQDVLQRARQAALQARQQAGKGWLVAAPSGDRQPLQPPDPSRRLAEGG